MSSYKTGEGYVYDRMLVLAPHHDDAEFGMGGWMHRAATNGLGKFRVVVACGDDYIRTGGEAVRPQDRELESQQALGILRVTDYAFRQWFHENRGDTTSRVQLVSCIDIAIEEYKPTELFIPLPSFNQDHTALYEAAITATRPGRHTGIRNIFAYEYPGNCWGTQYPNAGICYVKLSAADLAAKMKALHCHKTQFAGRVAAVGPEAAYALARQRGAEVGITAAEAYWLLREVF